LKWLFRGPKALIFNEPTRGTDVGAKAEIYELLGNLAAAGRGIPVVSSDLPELMAICHLRRLYSPGALDRLQLLGAEDNVKPIVIGTVIVLAVILDTYRNKFLRVMESR
jgi:ABC-type uncharacterized transport system ATPase subunit